VKKSFNIQELLHHKFKHHEKTQPIQWTERPTGALVAVNSLRPWNQANAPLLRQELSKGTKNPI
jgi:hypothetical protein